MSHGRNCEVVILNQGVKDISKVTHALKGSGANTETFAGWCKGSESTVDQKFFRRHWIQSQAPQFIYFLFFVSFHFIFFRKQGSLYDLREVLRRDEIIRQREGHMGDSSYRTFVGLD